MKRRPCAHPDIKQRADLARQRLDAAINDMLQAAAGFTEGEDDASFYRELGRLIREDNVIEMKRKKTK